MLCGAIFLFLVLSTSLLAESSETNSETQVLTETKQEGEIETTVRAKRPITAASSSTIRNRDLKLRPLARPADVLEVTPGLFVVQHAGGGKANQYFLRGYDADHGTDLALLVDGVPVNLVSHGHGQGYADLNWLLPEVVDHVDVLKGTYFPEMGDFARAGALNIVTHKTLPTNQAKIAGGMYGTGRVFALSSTPFLGLTPLIAAEIYRTDGPFLSPQKTKRFSYFAKLSKDFSSSTTASLGTTGYGGDWNASGQIPQREVNAGRMDRFGAIDNTEGGNSNRYSIFGNFFTAFSESSSLKANAFFNYYRLNLFSNFTFFSSNPTDGDQINQIDNRTTGGGSLQYKLAKDLSGISSDSLIGFQVRSDSIKNGLFNTKAREFLSTTKSNEIKQHSLALYFSEDTTWTQWFRSVVAIRGDTYHFTGKDFTTDSDLGFKDDYVISPKTSLIFGPFEKTEIFLNYGQGFHSNDARGILSPTDSATALHKVYTYEVGSRTKVLNNKLDLAWALFLQYSDGELIYTGDSGTTSNIGGTRRLGGELEARYEILDWLYTDVDLSLIKPELRSADESANSIPYAPTRVFSGGVSAQHPEGYFGRLGFFHMADRPATEDRFLTAEGFWRFDLTVGYKRPSYEFSLAVQNLFNSKWREAQFATTSRLPHETSAASCPAGTRPGDDGSGNFTGCEDIHFTPGNPLNVQATASIYF